ncbi:acyl-coenzyme A thioesterase PaaI-like protein [Actinomycetospora succinea]|uniref:Acyl-coenzyme A thioesterase PaaI-like protein n=1 Tax=Actinomycetospora succinea TaxID=663603 RepID=A0A4R6VMM4_9PSEU|nr:thioesterase family protein [Actinomycetospora succinea]TDQ63201.1 acyl-coenzyme A thioesterase PaaI-like protein [Actinomycetospora succinea]
MIGELALDSAAQRVGDGVHEIVLSDRWGLLDGRLNGGYQLSVALRALAAEIPLPDPVVASASYLRPAWPGPARVLTEVVRAGRRLATGTARLVQAGPDGDEREVLRLEATFADLAASPADPVDRTAPPDLPPPEECRTFGGTEAPPDGATVGQRIRYGVRELPGWVRGEPSGDPVAEFRFAFADGSDATLLDLAFVVDGAAPVVLELGRGSSTAQLTVHLREHPAPGPLVCRTVTNHLAHGLHDEDVEVWDSRGVLVAQSRQLALLL